MKVYNQPRFFGKAKSLFASLTFWSILCLLIQASEPRIEAMVEKKSMNAADVLGLVNIIAATVGGVIGRIVANEPVYTPKGFLGPNKSDFELKRRSDDPTDSAANILPDLPDSSKKD